MYCPQMDDDDDIPGPAIKSCPVTVKLIRTLTFFELTGTCWLV